MDKMSNTHRLIVNCTNAEKAASTQENHHQNFAEIQQHANLTPERRLANDSSSSLLHAAVRNAKRIFEEARTPTQQPLPSSTSSSSHISGRFSDELFLPFKKRATYLTPPAPVSQSQFPSSSMMAPFTQVATGNDSMLVQAGSQEEEEAAADTTPPSNHQSFSTVDRMMNSNSSTITISYENAATSNACVENDDDDDEDLNIELDCVRSLVGLSQLPVVIHHPPPSCKSGSGDGSSLGGGRGQGSDTTTAAVGSSCAAVAGDAAAGAVADGQQQQQQDESLTNFADYSYSEPATVLHHEALINSGGTDDNDAFENLATAAEHEQALARLLQKSSDAELTVHAPATSVYAQTSLLVNHHQAPNSNNFASSTLWSPITSSATPATLMTMMMSNNDAAMLAAYNQQQSSYLYNTPPMTTMANSNSNMLDGAFDILNATTYNLGNNSFTTHSPGYAKYGIAAAAAASVDAAAIDAAEVTDNTTMRYQFVPPKSESVPIHHHPVVERKNALPVKKHATTTTTKCRSVRRRRVSSQEEDVVDGKMVMEHPLRNRIARNAIASEASTMNAVLLPSSSSQNDLVTGLPTISNDVSADGSAMLFSTPSSDMRVKPKRQYIRRRAVVPVYNLPGFAADITDNVKDDVGGDAIGGTPPPPPPPFAVDVRQQTINTNSTGAATTGKRVRKQQNRRKLNANVSNNEDTGFLTLSVLTTTTKVVKKRRPAARTNKAMARALSDSDRPVVTTTATAGDHGDVAVLTAREALRNYLFTTKRVKLSSPPSSTLTTTTTTSVSEKAGVNNDAPKIDISPVIAKKDFLQGAKLQQFVVRDDDNDAVFKRASDAAAATATTKTMNDIGVSLPLVRSKQLVTVKMVRCLSTSFHCNLNNKNIEQQQQQRQFLSPPVGAAAAPSNDKHHHQDFVMVRDNNRGSRSPPSTPPVNDAVMLLSISNSTNNFASIATAAPALAAVPDISDSISIKDAAGSNDDTHFLMPTREKLASPFAVDTKNNKASHSQPPPLTDNEMLHAMNLTSCKISLSTKSDSILLSNNNNSNNGNGCNVSSVIQYHAQTKRI